MKLLVDMNLSPRWVETLSKAGFETVHWSAVGAANAPDVEIMAFAQENHYVVISHDLDFSAILAATQGSKPSVVQIRTENLTPDAIGTQLIKALSETVGELERGALVSIDPGRTRLRILPL